MSHLFMYSIRMSVVTLCIIFRCTEGRHVFFVFCRTLLSSTTPCLVRSTVTTFGRFSVDNLSVVLCKPAAGVIISRVHRHDDHAEQ